jgi:hypothetical protein
MAFFEPVSFHEGNASWPRTTDKKQNAITAKPITFAFIAASNPFNRLAFAPIYRAATKCSPFCFDLLLERIP